MHFLNSVTLAGLWSLDSLQDAATQEVLKDAAEHPDRYVLKPQREGGGNNLYGRQLKERLEDSKGLSAYILMQRIRPPVQKCVFHPILFHFPAPLSNLLDQDLCSPPRRHHHQCMQTGSKQDIKRDALYA